LADSTAEWRPSLC